MRLATVLLCSLMLSGDSLAGGRVEGVSRVTYSEFSAMPYSEREKRLPELLLEDQLSAYLVMIDESHPPDLGLATSIAPGGWPLARLVIDRMASDETEWVRARLMLLLSEIQVGGFADLRTDQATMAKLEAILGEMPESDWRESSERKLDFIKRGAYADPEDRAQLRLAYGEFARLPYLEREKRLRELSLGDQVTAFLALLNESHPPDLALGDLMAPGGWPLARIVLSRIVNERDEWVQAKLMFLLASIQASGCADLHAEAETVTVLEGVVNQIKSPDRKAEASDWLGLIKRGPARICPPRG